MDPLQPGDPRQVGDYMLRGRLGAGGMGEVFLGHTPGGRPVAVKLISPVFANDADFRRRFRREVEAARKVGGFHTAQLVDAQPDADRPWLVTAYVAGPSLARVIADLGALPVQSVRVLGSGLAEALQAIHAQGLIHRDLKPSNVLIAGDGPRVIDFGIARGTDASGNTAAIGTPGFMAPEVLTGEPLTPACDVFALGMVLAFASGIRPFGEGPSEAVGYRVVHQEPDLDGLDPGLRDIVADCLAKSPADRPSPEQILRRLASPGPVPEWLPGPVSAMVTAHHEDYQPAAVGGSDPVRAERLLGEAERLARAVSEPWRGRALVHIAAVTAQSDAAHAGRLLDDALHPPVSTAWKMTPDSRQSKLMSLAQVAASDIASVLSRMEAEPAIRLLADLDALAHSAELDDPHNNRRLSIAEIVAAVDADRAQLIADAAAPEFRASALDAVSRVVAQSDITKAAQIARSICDPATPQTLSGQRKRTWSFGKQRRYQPGSVLRCVEALTHLAVTAAGMTSAHSVQIPTRDRRTVSAERPAAPPPASPGEAGQLLDEAESIAHGLPEAGDERTRALVAVKSAAAQVWPDRSRRLLAEAEQYARAIADEQHRQLALGRIAMVAARTDPPQAEQISRSLHGAQELHPLALALAQTDSECAVRLATRIGDAYLTAIVKFATTMATERVPSIQPLRDAVAAAHNPSQIIQAAVLAAPFDPDWAEQITNPSDPDEWRERFGRNPFFQWRELKSQQASGLADLANALLGDKARPTVILG